MNRRILLTLGLMGAFLQALAVGASAEVHEVMMYSKNPENKKERNVFIPAVIKIKPGDTVKWISVEKGHNTMSLKKMLPEGVKKWKSKISKDFEMTFEKVGIYGYKCQPHVGLGMVGIVVVDGEGWDANLEALKKVKQKGKSKKVFPKLFEQVDAFKTN